MSHLLFEIGTEELPSGEITSALEALEAHFREQAENARLSFQSIHTYSTPRRLALVVNGLSDAGETLTETVTGPPLRRPARMRSPGR